MEHWRGREGKGKERGRGVIDAHVLSSKPSVLNFYCFFNVYFIIKAGQYEQMERFKEYNSERKRK